MPCKIVWKINAMDLFERGMLEYSWRFYCASKDDYFKSRNFRE